MTPNIKEEKEFRTDEMSNALDAVAAGIDTDGKVGKEFLEAAQVIIGVRSDLEKVVAKTPRIREFIRNVERSLDSLMVAEMEQPDAKKRKRAVGEILERINRGLRKIGFEDSNLATAVNVDIPEDVA